MPSSAGSPPSTSQSTSFLILSPQSPGSVYDNHQGKTKMHNGIGSNRIKMSGILLPSSSTSTSSVSAPTTPTPTPTPPVLVPTIGTPVTQTTSSSSSSWVKSNPNSTQSGQSSSPTHLQQQQQHPPVTRRQTTSSLTRSLSSLFSSSSNKSKHSPPGSGSPSGLQPPSKHSRHTSDSIDLSAKPLPPLPSASGHRDPSASPSFLIPLSQIKQQFNNHQPKPNICWDASGHLRIELEIREDSTTFDLIVTYMYKGKLDINDDNCVSILFYANHFLIHSLKKLVSDYIVEHITSTNVTTWLDKAIEFNTTELIPRCIFVIARNFNQIVENELVVPASKPTSSSSKTGSTTSITSTSNASTATMTTTATSTPSVTTTATTTKSNTNTFSFLPFDMFLQILEHPSLSVFSEFNVYLAICSYVDSKSDLLSSQQIEQLFEKVRFPYLSYAEFLQVIQNPLVPQDLLTDGLMIRLGNFECPGSATLQKRLSDPRFMKRKIPGRLFDYVHDYDSKGVLYYFGTNGYTTEWTNPALTPTADNPRVKITASPMEKGAPSDIADLKPTECWTKDVPSSWFCIDLGGSNMLIPRYYTLRHGGNSKQDCLRNWVLQGSEDSHDWFNIARYQNDLALNSNYVSHTWSVQCSSPYRYFRILQTGHNSTSHNFLSLSGVEFYGELIQNLDNRK
ncbi:hypothetical protein SAMD00019534_023170 [Acytostelium subglobosum LB1]|uniref:hypothetical protein n=1 Tax=Acytostelium subglobosum LB1 TaxID=1410327 RepID=UPI00064490CF|nr:hypothetical protein SAMD00019534_023170 [Acytostelium subglobosum LB1]GAM19142.1 hypothetical protein SAMD00019534_023170 [Acytostelium subglobosum LB1]|eukprot:XP_012757069.1 hypothetical protein SAMD00019534_023170 [Acytostelium subglobosum LB1]